MRTILTLISIFFFSQVNAYTLPQHPVKPYDCDMCDNLSHEELQAQWKTPAIPLKQAGSNIQKSYSYNKKVTAEQLKQGVTLPINAPGAVLRITPLQNKDIPALELKSTSTGFMSLKDASSLYSQDEAIDESLRI
ncbi:MAG: DUF4785 family protein, partial [Legionella longbeachae]|nr:DUF4785 family protein [Legionella longbeachae]